MKRWIEKEVREECEKRVWERWNEVRLTARGQVSMICLMYLNTSTTVAAEVST